jgi:putative ABC transport system permease protein
MGITEMLRTATTALRVHKLRTSLSVLGIVMGVAAIVAIVAIVNGATAQMKERIAGLGMRTITISILPNAVSSASATRALTEELTTRLLAAPSVSQVVPTSSSRASAIIDGETWDASVMGVTAGFMGLFDGFYPVEGRFIHALDDQRKVVVLGAGFASDYFAGENPVGQRLTLEISNQKVAFQIVGVMSARGTVGYQDLDDTIYVPLSTVQLLSGSRQFTSYIAQASSEGGVEEAASEIETILAQVVASSSSTSTSTYATRAFGEGANGPTAMSFLSSGAASTSRTPYRVTVQKEAIQTYQESVDTMTLILGGIGAISLLVGGIGIMNIMLVSVTERTREIGIRMAIGARPRTIRTQFLVEAVLTCLLGGLLGLGIGWLCGWLGSLFGDWPFVISIYPALLATGFSLAIGVGFGLYPALRASKLDPVEALRYE